MSDRILTEEEQNKISGGVKRLPKETPLAKDLTRTLAEDAENACLASISPEPVCLSKESFLGRFLDQKPEE